MIISNNEYFALILKPCQFGYELLQINKDDRELDPVTFEEKKVMTKKIIPLSKKEIQSIYDATIGQEEIDEKCDSLYLEDYEIRGTQAEDLEKFFGDHLDEVCHE